MSRLNIASLTLCLCWMICSPAAAETMADQPPPPLKCKCNDDCKQDIYGRHFCYIYSSLGDGWCDWSGPGKPCSKEAGVDIPPLPEPPTKEQGPPLPPEQGPGLEPGYPEQGPGLEPGYPESDPWYEDMKAVSPTVDAGPAATSDGGEDNDLTSREGCSIHHGASVSWPLGILLLAALIRRRRHR